MLLLNIYLLDLPPLYMQGHPYGFGFVVDDCAAQLREQRDSRASQLSQLSLQLSVEALEDFAASSTFPETFVN